jgi:hypothetical protein
MERRKMAKYMVSAQITVEAESAQEAEYFVEAHMPPLHDPAAVDWKIGVAIPQALEKGERDEVSRRTPRLALLGDQPPAGMDG